MRIRRRELLLDQRQHAEATGYTSMAPRDCSLERDTTLRWTSHNTNPPLPLMRNR